MLKFNTVLLSFYFMGLTLEMPNNNELLDKATINDVGINSVSEDKKPDLLLLQQQQQQQQQLHNIHNQFQQQNHQLQAPSTVEISGITTGANPAPANPAGPQDNGGFRPQRAGSMFARLIDDIFQIPIAVLQNVAKLITNPFTRKEASAAA